MFHAGVKTWILLLFVSLCLLGGYVLVYRVSAQGDSEAVYFYAEGHKVPVRVGTSELGLLLRDGVSPDRLKPLLADLHLRQARVYNDVLVLVLLEKAMPRQELVQFARFVQKRGEGLIARAGLTLYARSAEEPMVLTDELIVQFRRGVKKEEIQAPLASDGAEILMQNPFVKEQYLVRVTSASKLDALDLANLYQEKKSVEFAHPNLLQLVYARQFNPNDTLYNNQWHHNNTGQSGGTVDADIDTNWAWTITQGNAATIIAAIDGGFDLTHPDLTANYWTNAAEVANNNVDDDNNQFVDDVNGWDFTGCDAIVNPQPGCGDNNPTGPDTQFGRHGTAVAGTAAARGNNALGVTGSCPQCRLMPLRIGGAAGAFSQVLAFGYAQAMGAQVMTNSWGYPIGTPVTTAVVNAINAAATNGRNNLGSVVLFAMNNPNVNDCVGANPDISAIPNVIAVSRSTNRDQFDFSGFGNCMDILAPTAGLQTVPSGRGTLWITTTDMQGAAGYNNNATSPSCPSAEPSPPPANARDYTMCFNGTSSATPLTAGVAGLVLTASPNLTRLQVQQLIQDTADRIEDSTGAYADNVGFSTPAGGNATHGWGRVNAFEAVRVVAPPAQGGRGGVDIFLRDNRLDWGNTEQPSNVTFEPVRGFIPHYRSVDIKVDAPPFQPAPVTSADFDALVDEKPKTGQLNRAYVRVRNRGPVTATTVNVKLHWADAGPGLPGLPNDFWTAWPGDPASTAVWHPLPCNANPASTVCTLTNLAYSGASVAGCPGRAQPVCPGGNDAAQVVAFDFQGPAIGPSGVNHFCLFAVIDSPQDRAGPLTRVPGPNDMHPDLLTPVDNNVTHRNIEVDDSGRSSRFEERFYVRNPFDRAVRARLVVKAPVGWLVSIDKFKMGEIFPLEPKKEALVRMTVKLPKEGVTGEVNLQQETWLGRRKVIGGIDYRFRPETPRPLGIAHYASLNGISLVGDPQTGSVVNYLGDGSSYGAKPNDTFSFAPIQLPHGAEIQRLKCVVLDNTPQGYIQVTLNRGPINTSDSITPSQVIASAVTFPSTTSPGFLEITGNAEPTRAVVNNASYGYFFRVDFLDNPGTPGEPTLKLRGCSVEYLK